MTDSGDLGLITKVNWFRPNKYDTIKCDEIYLAIIEEKRDSAFSLLSNLVTTFDFKQISSPDYLFSLFDKFACVNFNCCLDALDIRKKSPNFVRFAITFKNKSKKKSKFEIHTKSLSFIIQAKIQVTYKMKVNTVVKLLSTNKTYLTINLSFLFTTYFNILNTKINLQARAGQIGSVIFHNIH